MPAIAAPFPNLLTPALAAATLASWSVALWQSLPRLLAGPLCTSQQDAFSLAGHCPACFVAVGLSLALLVSLWRSRGRATAS